MRAAGAAGERLWGLVEQQRGTTVLWAPVALTFGIWSYFALPQEPALSMTVFLSLVAIVLFLFARARMGMLLMAIFLSGFVLAKFRTETIATPLLRATTGEIVVSGIVTDVERASDQRRTIILRPTEIEGVTTVQLPHRLRLSNSIKNGEPEIGARVAFKARLSPNASPTIPGGFDYGRQLYFDGIGGSGRITSKIDVLGATTSAPLWLSSSLHGLREEIGSRIRVHLHGTIAAIAEAMITGERAAIPKEVNKSFQISGLAHILSISGLHMSLAAGGVFWVIRALLALFPPIAQRWPIKKWAAGAALVFGFIYMLLAGSQAATQRSYIMLAVVFLAVMVDRPAISLRNLALAALLILILQPESAIQASFQMSFMAVMGLAAFFEYWNRPKGEKEYRIESRLMLYIRRIFNIVVASILTTLVAGGFSSIPAAYHFGRLAPYGVIANGLAIPVMSFIVMPFALLSVVLMPFGLEALPLVILGKGLAISFAIGAALVCLMKERAKYAGALFLVAGLTMAQFTAPPDVLIERTAANVAFRNGSDELVFANSHKGRFAAEKWLQANGEETAFKEAVARTGWTCDARSCRAEVKGKVIGYFMEAEGTAPSCDGLDIIVAAYPLRGACKSVTTRIDRFDVWRMGSHAISINGNDLGITTARGLSGSRPWVVVPEPRKKPDLTH